MEAAPWGPRSGLKGMVLPSQTAGGGSAWKLLVIGGLGPMVSGVEGNNSAAAVGGPVDLQDVWGSDDGLHWTLLTANAGWPPRRAFACAVHTVAGKASQVLVAGGFSTASPDPGQGLRDLWQSADGITWMALTLDDHRCPSSLACSTAFQVHSVVSR